MKIKRSYNELNELKYNIMNNIANFGIFNFESFIDKKRGEIKQSLLRNPQLIKQTNDIKEINFWIFAENGNYWIKCLIRYKY